MRNRSGIALLSGRWVRLLYTTLIFMLVLGNGSALQAQPESLRVHPVLLQWAAEHPDDTFMVIIQREVKNKDLKEDEPETAVTKGGGKVKKQLAMIESFSAEVTGKEIAKLAKKKKVRWITLDAPVRSMQTSSETVRDEFSTGSYSGNNGTVNWIGGWVESDPEAGGTGPTVGQVQIVSGELRLDDQPDTGGYPSAARGIDLSNGVTSAIFTFAFHTASGVDSSDAVAVEVSSNGGTSYTTLETITNISGATAGSSSFDISNYSSANTTIRFRVTNSYGGSNEYLYVDNVQIAYTTEPTSAPTPTLTPTPTPTTPAASPVGAFTVRDEFASRVYNGDDGAESWSSTWIEIDEPSGSGPTDGPVQVSPNSTYCLSPNCLRVGGSKQNNPDPGFGVSRQVDLSGAGSATLIYSYRRGTFGSCSAPYGALTLDLSGDGGTSWTTLKTYPMDGVDASQTSESFDISSYSAANTQIRFLTHGPDNDCVFFADNIEIAYAIPSSFVQTVGTEQLWHQAPPLKGQGVTIAVIDSGIAAHGDLNNTSNGNSRIVASVDLTGSPGGGDGNGHGTHVAGIIAGNGNATGGARPGIAPKANLIDIKVSNNQGVSLVSDVVEGLQWVHENKDTYNIRVVNLSLNSTVPESYHISPLSAAVEILWFNGVTVVVAAGNNGDGNGPVTLYPPANDPFVITVGAVDDMGTPLLSDDGLTTFSAYGTTEDGFVKPDLVAPGRNIISLLASTNASVYVDHPAHRVDNKVFRMSGTSMAAPVVTGAIALLLEDEPNLTPDQVKHRLISTAGTNWPGYDGVKAGAGTLDIYAAVQGTSTASANTGLAASQMLWSGDDPVAWESVSWNSVSWNSVSWNSVSWNSVSWNSVSWNSEVWHSGIWDDEPVSASGVMGNESMSAPDNSTSATTIMDTPTEQTTEPQANQLFLPLINR